jgi:YVTN family beta-propeller protein
VIYQQHTLGGDIAVFDDASGDRLVGRIALGEGLIPDSVALSADGATLYANFANRWEFWQNPTRESRSCFAAFDAHTLALQWRVPLLGFAEHFAHDAARRYFYIAHYDRKLLSRVDVETREVLPISIANMGGHKVRVAPDGRHVYVGSIVWGSLDEIDVARAKWTRQRTFEHNVRPFALSPDSSRIYVQLSHLHGFHVLDAATLKTLAVVALPPLKPGCLAVEPHYPFTTDHGIEVTPDGRYLICLATTGHEVVIYDHPSLQWRATIAVGQQPSYVCVSKTRPLAYVSCRASNALYVIDLDTLSVARTIENTGAFPQRIAVNH